MEDIRRNLETWELILVYLKEGTKSYELIWKEARFQERHRHRYEVNNALPIEADLKLKNGYDASFRNSKFPGWTIFGMR